MSNEKKREVIHTKIWHEEPEPDNPFAARKCICSGYDVYGDLLGKISWIEYLYLLIKLEPPTTQQARLLEGIAVAIANPGPRDSSVRAAMNAGVGGSTTASYLMAALAPGAGQFGGAREVVLFHRMIIDLGLNLENWVCALASFSKEGTAKEGTAEVWPEIGHVPGFDPYGTNCTKPVRQTLDHLEKYSSGRTLIWLKECRREIEMAAGAPITMVAVVSAAFHDLEFNAEEAELLYLLFRLPGAGVHALEQSRLGWRKYPFFGNGLKLDTKAD